MLISLIRQITLTIIRTRLGELCMQGNAGKKGTSPVKIGQAAQSLFIVKYFKITFCFVFYIEELRSIHI